MKYLSYIVMSIIVGIIVTSCSDMPASKDDSKHAKQGFKN